MKKTTQRFIKEFDAIDITRESFEVIRDLQRKSDLQVIYYSIGTYGINGAILKDYKNGYLYKITARTSSLFQLV